MVYLDYMVIRTIAAYIMTKELRSNVVILSSRVMIFSLVYRD